MSESKSNTFEQCRLKYKYYYVDKLEKQGEKQPHLDFGSYIHEIFELGYEKDTLADLLIIANDIKKSYRITEGYEKKVETCLRNFLRFNASLGETIGAEWAYEVVYDSEKDIKFNGIIDRIIRSKDGKEFLIIDYKTGRRELKKHDLFQNTQLQGYAYAVHKLMEVPIENITVAHYYPMSGNFVSVKYSWPQIGSYLKKKLTTFWNIRKAKKDDMCPSQNQFCDWCDYKDICPIFNNQSKINESKESMYSVRKRRS